MIKNNHYILALVGQSGVGKTAILLELIKQQPDKFFPIQVLTNRPRRGPEDDIFCKFVSTEYIKSKKNKGELIQYFEYANNLYGLEKDSLDKILSKGIGVQAFIETGIDNLKALGYQVTVVKVVTEKPIYRDEKRFEEDKKRELYKINYDLILNNSFELRGINNTVEQLLSFLDQKAK